MCRKYGDIGVESLWGLGMYETLNDEDQLWVQGVLVRNIENIRKSGVCDRIHNWALKEALLKQFDNN